MILINEAIRFFQENWIAIILIVGILIVLLKAVADFKVRWAKVTPEPQDDAEAKLFRAKVWVIIKFIKDIFSLNKKDKNEK